MIEEILIDGKDSRLYMEYDKILPSAQGMAIWEDKAYILYNTGVCAVYDLKTRRSEPLAQFPLGSYNNGIPTKDYLNHANSCMFSDIHYRGNPIPLLYVVIGSGIGEDEDGFYYRCAVENIVRIVDKQGKESYTAETIQVISYRSGNEEKYGYERPCWGCPSFLIDCQAESLYIFSARYRTKYGYVPEGKANTYIISKFHLPKYSDGNKIQLRAENIIDQFSVESDVMFTQGGTIADGKLYYTFGCPCIQYPVVIMVFDLEKRKLYRQVRNLDQAFRNEEIECCDFYDGKFLCNTSAGSLFEVLL